MVPRYVQAPALRDHGLGPRNLFWGVALLFVALVLLVIAVFLAGPKAMLYVMTCLVTFTALFVLTRLHIFRQRNGGFLALALVCVIGAGIPLVEKAFEAAKGIVTSQSALAATAPSAPVVTLHSDEPQMPLLTQAFALSLPQGAGKQVKVLHDSPVVIEGKHFLIKAGDRFPYVASKGEETTFAVRDLRVALPNGAVEVVDPSALAKGVSGGSSGQMPAGATTKDKDSKSAAAAPSDAELAEITRSAQQEAMRRYPALAIKDSIENAEFLSMYKQFREAGSEEFFSNPEWPMQLAELLAQREGWVRGGGPITTGPAPVLDPPADNAVNNNPPPRAQSVRPAGNLPPVESLDAGADLPGGSRR